MTSEREAAGWKELFWQVALALKCLPSTYVDGNEHVLRAAARTPAVGEAEPVARYLHPLGMGRGIVSIAEGAVIEIHAPLYAHPMGAALTDADVTKLYVKWQQEDGRGHADLIRDAERAVLAKAGIRGME